MAFPEFSKYFNGTAISTSYVLSASGALPVMLIMDLTVSDSVILSFCSSL